MFLFSPQYISHFLFYSVIGVPLVFETFSWQHGVSVGACVKSEATAAAEFKGNQIYNKP